MSKEVQKETLNEVELEMVNGGAQQFGEGMARAVAAPFQAMGAAFGNKGG